MKGDFTGFTLGEFHSSDLGIVRIADGDRYDEALLPDIEDKTVDIPGNDGSYYYGSYYKPREFKINVAFDRINNEQFRKLKRVTSNRKLFELTFDEAPYKTYLVKATNPPEFHYVCFDESKLEYTSENHNGYIPGSINHIKGNSEPEMIYKGEGDLTFTAYNPFGFSKYKTLEEAAEDYDNVDEWAKTSGIHSEEDHEGYDIPAVYTIYKVNEEDNPSELGLYIKENDEYILTEDISPVEGTTYYKKNNGKGIKVYNPGDISAPFKLYIPFNNGTIPATTIQLQDSNGTSIEGYTFILDAVEKITTGNIEHSGILINTKNQLVEGATEDSGGNIKVESKLVYNEYATRGNFFKIPTGSINSNEEYCGFDGIINISGASNGIIIDYDYLYF